VLLFRIRDGQKFRILIRNPDQESGSGIRIRGKQPVSYFPELKNHFFVLKYLNSLIWLGDLGSRMEKIRSGMEKVGSGINIRDPRHCYCVAKPESGMIIGS
jgi:hypothetical protein